MGKRNYNLLLGSQFLSALGDNAILAVILGQLLLLRQEGSISDDHLRAANAIYTALLFVPYVLFATLVGWLNDRFPKNRCLRAGNMLKLLGAGICMLSLWRGYYWQGIGYFIVGIGSCLYSPAKYGILPEIVPRERLVKANGTVELLTLVAILGGMFTGAKLIDEQPPLTCYIVLMGIFGASYLMNHLMSRTPHNPEAHFRGNSREFFLHFGDLFRSPRLARVLVGIALFWICGAMMKMNFQPWGMEVLGLTTNTQVALLSLWLAIGVMIGSVVAGQIFKVGNLRGTRPVGFALALTIGLLGFIQALRKADVITSRAPVVVLLILGGIAAGLFLIPLNAALQAESHQGKLGKTIAIQNFIDNIGMVATAGALLFSVKIGLTSSGVFFLLGTLIAVVTFFLRIPPLEEAAPIPARARD